MAGPIGSIKVQVGNQVGTIKVQVNDQQKETVRSISYGARTIKSATDLYAGQAEDGDAIIYQANTNSFVIAPVESKGISDVDAGEF